VPTASGITQARKRLGPKVLAEVFEQVARPQASMLTRGAWLRGWRLLAIDGFEVDVPDTEANIAEFGYAGSGDNRSAFPKARVVALAECGTHVFLAAQVGAYGVGEKTLAKGLYGRLRVDELLSADRNFYSFEAWDLATRSGAALLWRAPTQLQLPVIKVLPDGTYLSVLINPSIRGARRRAAILAAATQIADVNEGVELDPTEAHLVRVVEYDVPDRAGNGAGELIVVLSTILDPAAARADELAAAYHERWGGRNRQRPAQDPPTWTGESAALTAAGAGPAGDLGVAAGPARPDRVDHQSGRGRRPRSRPGSPSPGSCASPAVPPPVRRAFPPDRTGTTPCPTSWPPSPPRSTPPGGSAAARARPNAPATTTTASRNPARPPPIIPARPRSTSTR